MKLHKILIGVLLIASILALVYFLWWHLRLGLVRYFDVDEFAYLHWANRVLAGKRPYVDFFLYVPAGFVFFLAPIFWFASGTGPVIVGRIVTWFIFVGMTGLVIALFWETRRSWLALLAGIILAFLPLPIDKFIEIRPDNLAMLLVLLGIWLQLRFWRSTKPKLGFASGLAYAASVLVVTKTLPNVMVAAALAVWYAASHKPWRRHLLPLVTGFLTPMVAYGLWALTLGDLGVVLYSLLKLPLEVNNIGKIFIMMPYLFFYPNGIFYGSDGWTAGLLTNHVVWIVGLGMGIYRLFTPLLAQKEKSSLWEELLIASNFIVQVIVYVQIVPLRHTQYLVPIAVFVAWYAADAVWLLWQWLRQMPAGRAVFAVVYLALLGFLLNTLVKVNGPKLNWTNTAALTIMEEVLRTIPKGAYVLDLDGSTLYYPDPYYACCIPFGQMAPFMSRTLPSLSQALEQTQTKYIYQGDLRRVTTLLPADQQWIGEHYEPYQGDYRLLVRKNVLQ